MITRVQKWGNSLALRIPKSYAIEAGIETDSAVEISLEKGKLVVTPVVKTRPSLKQLVAQITEENRHGEMDTGPAQGNEAW